ncbi:hypothetical protein AMTRI_Chr05g72760 [Amborella trichopoda]
MDFVEGLPISKGKSVVLVVVDRLSKYAHFIPLSHSYTATAVAQIFFDQVFKLHGMPRTIICDRDSTFTSNFWLISWAEYCYNPSWHSTIKTTSFEVKIKELRVILKEAQKHIKKVYDSTLSLRKNLKLSPWNYGSYQIVERIRAVVFKLDLLEESLIHPMFHVSLLKKKVADDTLVQTELPSVREDDQTLHPKP